MSEDGNLYTINSLRSQYRSYCVVEDFAGGTESRTRLISFDASPIALAPPKLRVFTMKQRSSPFGIVLLRPWGELQRLADHKARDVPTRRPDPKAKPAGDTPHRENRIEVRRTRIPPSPVIDQLLDGDGREARIDGLAWKRGPVVTEPGKYWRTRARLGRQRQASPRAPLQQSLHRRVKAVEFLDPRAGDRPPARRRGENRTRQQVRHSREHAQGAAAGGGMKLGH
jgi:hypothetical protein